MWQRSSIKTDSDEVSGVLDIDTSFYSIEEPGLLGIDSNYDNIEVSCLLGIDTSYGNIEERSQIRVPMEKHKGSYRSQSGDMENA
ncbi:hypothetical protein PoB_006296100 [Plakobranchus ocellatus]|uniref:Uncharacterized protein n=1 Tax=Plakobranchus ocellatus TaxID=259542 RepID=A0AAV4CX73_9GAST|nr:hypothetical protein PoB_006296100 [Plakobranchus ocellatus]